MAKSQRTHHFGDRNGQGMVEFALILPMLLALLMGIIEFGRMFSIYNGVSNSAREAARWGSVVGIAPSGVEYYKDCAGMKAAAQRAAILTALDRITISYERPNPSASSKFDLLGTCDSADNPPAGADEMENGYRITIEVRATYRPVVPLVPIPARTFTATASRTVFTSIIGAPACNDDIDNDNDGTTDYSPVPGLGDSDCTSENDTLEQPDASSTNCYALTIEIDPGAGPNNTVTASPAGSNGCPAGSYNYNTTVTLTAVNADGKRLTYWLNTNNNGVNPTTVTMTSNKMIIAHFDSVPCYTLTHVVVAGSGDPPATSPPGDCGSADSYTEGTQVQLTARPAPGYLLQGWKDQYNGWHWFSPLSLNPVTITMDGDKTFNASYAPSTTCYNFDVNINGQGLVQVDPASNSPCPGQKRKGSVALTALPEPTYVFTGWSGDIITISNPLIVSMSGPLSIEANFQRCYSVLYFVANGTVSIYPQSTGGCPGLSYVEGSSVTLYANGNAGFTFAGWTGNPAGTDPNNPSLTIGNISADHLLTANFVASTDCYSLGLSVNPDEAEPQDDGGSITIQSPVPPNCTSVPGQYLKNTNVQLRALPNTSSFTFGNWTDSGGAVLGTSDTLTVRMDSNKNIIANFTPKCYTLDVTYGPNGTASASTAPQCTTSNGLPGYYYGALITVTASPNSGYDLAAWSGGGLSGDANPATFQIRSDTTVNATFERACYTLTVGVASGTGTVTTPSPGPGDANCRPNEYLGGTTVTFQAIPAGTLEFWNWTDENGVVIDASPTVTVVVADNLTYLANFEQCYTLISDPVPTGAGTISRDKSPDCNNNTQYSAETIVTLTAQAGPGYEWGSWDGGETAQSIQVTMNTDTTENANFIATCHTLTTVVIPDTTGTPPVPSPGGSIGVVVDNAPNGTCPNAGQYTTGTQLTLTASANSDYTFAGWNRAGSASGTYTLTINGPVTATARFLSSCAIAGPITGTANTIRLTVTNYTGLNALNINEIQLTWPAGSNSNKFKHIDFGSSRIWDGWLSSQQSNITTTINSTTNGGWESGAVLGITDTVARELKFYFWGFIANAAGRSYTVRVLFNNGCSINVSKTFP